MNNQTFIHVLSILKQEFPHWNSPVETLMKLKSSYTPYELLIATLLSLRSKDIVTIPIAQNLLKIANNPYQMINTPPEEIEKIIFKIGFYKQKTRTILDISHRLINDFNGEVPSNLDDLLSLKGVGRKTAALVLSVGFNIPAICVDIHVHRISNRLGFLNSKDPLETELTLMEKVPQQELWRDINYLIVGFGQTICTPISPFCNKCPVKEHCQKVGVSSNR